MSTIQYSESAASSAVAAGYVLTYSAPGSPPSFQSPAGGGSTGGSIGVTINGNGSVISTGLKGYIYIPIGFTISAYTILGNSTGSISLDVWRCTYAQFDAGVSAPTSSMSLISTSTGASLPNASSATKAQSTSLSGWTTSISAGDILAVTVASISNFSQVNFSLSISS